jgi:hypothetical protein
MLIQEFMMATSIFRKPDLPQLHSPQMKQGMSKNEISSPLIARLAGWRGRSAYMR